MKNIGMQRVTDQSWPLSVLDVTPDPAQTEFIKEFRYAKQGCIAGAFPHHMTYELKSFAPFMLGNFKCCVVV